MPLGALLVKYGKRWGMVAGGPADSCKAVDDDSKVIIPSPSCRCVQDEGSREQWPERSSGNGEDVDKGDHEVAILERYNLCDDVGIGRLRARSKSTKDGASDELID